MTDVLIAGGGIAGSALAILLGRQGLSVEVLERSEFPREKPCGEGLMPAGVAALRRLGLADAISAEPFQGVRYRIGGRIFEGSFPVGDGSRLTGWGLRRRHFDRMLADAAAATPGVVFHTGTRVDAPLVGQGRVTGLRVAGKPLHARLVVAADGVHSPLRRALGLDRPLRRKRFGARAHFRLAAGHKHEPWVDVFVARGHELYVTPLPEGELLVAALADVQVFGAPMQKVFVRWLHTEPDLAARLEGSEQITPLHGVSPLGCRARKGFTPGMALLGDAAGFVDPITGGGMTQALVTAELLSGYIGSRGLQEADRWLGEFDRERNALLRDYHRLTRAVLWLSSHPRLANPILAGLSSAPEIFRHLIGVAGGVRRLTGFPVNAPRPA